MLLLQAYLGIKPAACNLTTQTPGMRIMAKKTSEELFESCVASHDNFVVIPHYNPDPDALGSAFALQYLLSKYFNKQAIINSELGSVTDVY